MPLHLEYEISRHEFIEAIRDLLDQTLDSVDHVLEDAGVTAEDISQVLLVGGSTRIPAVWELVANYLDTEPHMSINPEEAVALGAGVQAAIIDGVPIDAILVDVTPHSLGIKVAEIRMGRVITDRYSVLIRRNTTVPVTREEVYTTLYPDQDTVEISVYQGESRIASENTLLGKFLIHGLKPERPGELAQVTVRFDLDINGILKVTARDRVTGQQKEITVEASRARLSESEILQARKWMQETAPRTEESVLVRRARQLLSKDELKPEERGELEELIAGVEAARAEGDTELVEELEERLLDLLFDLEE